jgi:hypothetical protein
VTPSLRFPLLCANADAGLPGTALIDTEAAAVGVIGLTNPQIDLSSRRPRPFDDWRVEELARELRGGGARWVVALLHDGVEWWPSGDGIATRPDRLDALVRPWAAAVDVILCGHNFGAWTGTLGGTPAGEVVAGTSAETWLTRTGPRRYLPDLLAHALRDATGVDAALVLPGMHGTQPPIDGAVSALRAGPITALDLTRLLPSPEYDPVVVALRRGESRGRSPRTTRRPTRPTARPTGSGGTGAACAPA